MNHKNLALADKINLLGELEHLRRHCLRSAHTIGDKEKKFYYQVKAKQLKDLRRNTQKKWLGTDEIDWCIVKSSACLKQLNNELAAEDLELYSNIESIADELLGHALGEDLRGCSSCRDDVKDNSRNNNHPATAISLILEQGMNEQKEKDLDI